MNLLVELSQRLGERILHDQGQSIQLSAIKPFLDEAPLCLPGFPVSGQKTFTQKVAHPLYLNFGFLVVLGIGLQHMLNEQ